MVWSSFLQWREETTLYMASSGTLVRSEGTLGGDSVYTTGPQSLHHVVPSSSQSCIVVNNDIF